jgi:hypothetical protein
MTKYTKLTKADLRGFDAESTKLILWAIEQGATGKVSNRGHCILRGPDGRTTAVARKMTSQNRTAQNTRAQVARLFRKQ